MVNAQDESKWFCKVSLGGVGWGGQHIQVTTEKAPGRARTDRW